MNSQRCGRLALEADAGDQPQLIRHDADRAAIIQALAEILLADLEREEREPATTSESGA